MKFSEIANLKKDYPNAVVLNRNGLFYNAYGDDAKVLSVSCDYKIVNNKCGFPSISLEKVTTLLSRNHISLYVDDMYFDFGDNYNIYLNLYNEKVRVNKNIDKLLDRIRNLIYSDGDNYYKIVDYLNGEYNE